MKTIAIEILVPYITKILENWALDSKSKDDAPLNKGITYLGKMVGAKAGRNITVTQAKQSKTKLLVTWLEKFECENSDEENFTTIKAKLNDAKEQMEEKSVSENVNGRETFTKTLETLINFIDKVFTELNKPLKSGESIITYMLHNPDAPLSNDLKRTIELKSDKNFAFNLLNIQKKTTNILNFFIYRCTAYFIKKVYDSFYHHSKNASLTRSKIQLLRNSIISLEATLRDLDFDSKTCQKTLVENLSKEIIFIQNQNTVLCGDNSVPLQVLDIKFIFGSIEGTANYRPQDGELFDEMESVKMECKKFLDAPKAESSPFPHATSIPIPAQRLHSIPQTHVNPIDISTSAGHDWAGSSLDSPRREIEKKSHSTGKITMFSPLKDESLLKDDLVSDDLEVSDFDIKAGNGGVDIKYPTMS